MPPSHIATVDSAVEFDGLSGDESRIRISLKSCSDVIVVLVEWPLQSLNHRRTEPSSSSSSSLRSRSSSSEWE